MKITVLAGNSVWKRNMMNENSEYGFSLYIEFDDKIIIFNTGQSDLYIQNAQKMGIDLSKTDYLILSQGNYDNRGGLRQFLKINNGAKIFLHISASQNFNRKIFGAIPNYGGIDQKNITQKSRIYFIDEDTQIHDKIILLEGFTEFSPQTVAKKTLFKKENNRLITDKFNHEIVMLLIENDEIVLFSGCLYSGIISIIEEVKLFSETMKIKAIFGSFHIQHSISKQNESKYNIEKLTDAPDKTDPIFYTVHSSGEEYFLYWMKGLMGNKVQIMNAGQIFEV